jgi:protein-S-isoprenylcysteine O-methyltransferase Ste14
MKRTLTTCLAVIVLLSLPLAADHVRLLDPRVLLVAAAAVVLLRSQPAVNLRDALDHSGQDRFSVVVLFAAAGASVLGSVAVWARGPAALLDPLPLVSGFLLMAGGLALRIWSIRTLGALFTACVATGDDHPIVTRGPYRLVRHPSYLGAFAAVLGVPVVLAAWPMVGVVALAMGAAYHYRIRLEERALAAGNPRAYAAYRTSGARRRFIPHVW